MSSASPQGSGDDEAPAAEPGKAHRMPEYRGHAVAREVFTDLHFYGGDERWRSLFTDYRDALGPTLTIDGLKRQCYERGQYVEDVLAGEYGVPLSHEYWLAGDVATLKEREYVALNRQRDLLAFRAWSGRQGRSGHERWEANQLPALDEMFQWGGNSQPHCYMAPSCYVLGPSGCGKTYFALEYLPGFLNKPEPGWLETDANKELPQVTLYLHPAEISDLVWEPPQPSEAGEIERDERGGRLVDWIRGKLEEELGRKLKSRLPMHVCIILDNAGDGRLCRFFESDGAMDDVERYAEKTIAERVVFVISGTGLNVDHIQEGRGGSYFFRTKPLQTEDLQRMLSRRFYANSAWRRMEGAFPVDDPDSEARAISRGIESHPALRAASRNIIMAVDVVDAIMSNIYACEAQPPSQGGVPHHRAAYWSAQVGASAAGLLRGALRRYVEASALSTLDPAQRRRVAVWTLWAMNLVKEFVQPRDSRGDFRYPEFPGLGGREREAAMAMIETHGVKYRNAYREVQLEKYLATMVPANLLVLFFVLGVPTSVLAGWPSVDAGTALYAALQWVVQKVQDHHDAVLRPLQESHCPDYDFEGPKATLRDLEEAIAQRAGDAGAAYRSAVESHEQALEASVRHLPMVLVPRWTLQAEDGYLRFPRAPGGSILVCTAGGAGDLPDVVAPHLFLRAVRGGAGGGGDGDDDDENDDDDHRPQDDVVDLESELRKRCLLKECADDDRFLRGMFALWSGAFDDHQGNLYDNLRWPRDNRDKDYDFLLVNPQGQWQEGYGTKRRRVELPKVGGREAIVFALTTRSDSIRVALPAGAVLTVTERMLTSDRQLRVEYPPPGGLPEGVTQKQLSSWTGFLRKNALPQVRVQFVFLRSDLSPLAATSVRKYSTNQLPGRRPLY